MQPIWVVLQTKLTPCTECVVRYQKALIMFWRTVHHWCWLSIWTGIMLPLKCRSLKYWGTASLPTLFLHGTRRSSDVILLVDESEEFKRTVMFMFTQKTLPNQQGGYMICGWTIARRRILRRQRSTTHWGGSLSGVPRLQYCTAERNHGRSRGWSKELDVEMSKIFGAWSNEVQWRISECCAV